MLLENKKIFGLLVFVISIMLLSTIQVDNTFIVVIDNDYVDLFDGQSDIAEEMNEVGLPFPTVNTMVEINNNTGLSEYDMMVYNHLYQAYFLNQSNGGEVLKYIDSQYETMWYVEYLEEWIYTDGVDDDYIGNNLGVDGVASDNVFNYPSILTDGEIFVDMRYVAGNTTVLSEYVLQEIPRTPAGYLGEDIQLAFGFMFDFPSGIHIMTDFNTTWDKDTDFITDKTLWFLKGDEDPADIDWQKRSSYNLPTPYAVDYNGDRINGTYNIQVKGNAFWIYKQIPYAWLENATYPVVIDPQVVDTTTYTAGNLIWRGAYSGPNYHIIAYQDGGGLQIARMPIGDLASFTITEVDAETTTYEADLIGYPNNDTLFIAYCEDDTDDLYMKKSTNGGLTWGAEKTIAVGGATQLHYPTIALALEGDSKGRILCTWRGAAYDVIADYTDDEGDTWNGPVTVYDDASGGDANSGDVIWIGDEIYITGIRVWAGGSAGKAYIIRTTDGGDTWTNEHISSAAGSGSTTEPTLTSPWMTTTNHSPWVVAITSDYGDLDDFNFIESSDSGDSWVESKRFDDVGTVLGAGWVISDAYGWDKNASFYMFCTERGVDDDIEYELKGTTGWKDPIVTTEEVVARTMWRGGKGPRNTNQYGNGIVWWMEDDPSPWDIVAQEFTFNGLYPRIQSASLINPDDGDNLYAKYKEYNFTVEIEYGYGFEDIDYVSLDFYNATGTYWRINFTESTGGFARTLGDNIIDAENCANVSSGFDTALYFMVLVDWDHPDYSDYDIKVYVVADNDDVDSATYDNNYDVETRLDYSVGPAVTSDDAGTVYRGDLDEAYTFEGTLIYYGSGDDNPPSDHVDVWLSQAQYGTNVGPWSDLILVAGAFSITGYGDDVVGNDTITVKPVDEAAGAGGTSLYYQADKTASYTADTLTITIVGPTDNRQNINANASGIVVSAVYDYDATAFDGTLTLNDTDYNGDGTVKRAGFNVSAATGDSHGVTIIGTNDETYMIWDRLQVTGYSASDTRDNIGDTVNIDVTVIYDYDNTAVTDGTIYINGTVGVHQGAGVWRITNTSASVVAKEFKIISAEENTYGISAIDMNGQSITIIWDEIEVYWVQVDDSRVNINANVEVRFKLRLKYDNTELNDAANDDVAGSLDLGGGSVNFTWDAGNSWWEYTFTYGSVDMGVVVIIDDAGFNYEATYEIRVTDSASVAAFHGQPIWDQITVRGYNTNSTDNRDNIQTYVNVSLWVQYEYDDTNVTDGTITINGEALSYLANWNWTALFSNASVSAAVWNTVAASGNTHGITSVNQNGKSLTYIWDALTAYVHKPTDQRNNINTNATGMIISAIYEYDSAAYDGTLQLNDTTYQYGTVGRRDYNVTVANGDDTYGITIISNNGNNTYCIWDALICYVSLPPDQRIDVSANCSGLVIWANYSYPDGTEQYDGTLQLNDTTYNHAVVGNYTYNVTIANGDDTYGITVITNAGNQTYCIFDRIVVTTDGYTYPFTRVNVHQNVTLWASAKLEFDNHALGAGDTIHFGDEIMTWNGTHFTASYTRHTVATWVFTLNSSGSNEATYGITVGTNTPVNIIFDRILIYNMWVHTYTSPDNRSDVSSAIYLYMSLVSEYDNESMATGLVQINGTLGVESSGDINATNYDDDIWRKDWTESTVGNYTFIITWMNWTTYNITEINYNGWNVTYLYNIYDRICLGNIWSDESDNRTYTGDVVTYYAYYYYDFNDANVTSASGTVMKLFGNSTTNFTTYTGTYDAGNGRWYYTDCVGSVLNYTFGVGAVGFNITTDGLYGLTLEANPNSITYWLVWDKVKWVSTTLNVTAESGTTYRVNITDTVNITILCQYEYDSTAVTDGTITLNGESLTHIANGYWYILVVNNTAALGQSYTFNAIVADSNAYDIETENQNSQTATIIWDQVLLLTFSTPDDHIDITQTFYINATLDLVYDDAVLGSGDSVSVNGSAMTWDTDHWYIQYGPLSAGTYYYVVSAVLESTYGITEFDLNGLSVTVSSLFIVISGYDSNSTDDRENINTYFSVNVTVEYAEAVRFPNATDLDSGTYIGGDLDSFTTSLDNDYYNFTEVVGTPGFMFYVNFSVPSSLFRELVTYAYYDGSAGHTIYMQIYNFTSGSWDTLGTLPDDSAFHWHNYTISDCGCYVSGNEVWVRFNHASPGNTNHHMHIDYIALWSNITAVTDGTVVINGYSFTHIGSGVWQYNITNTTAVATVFNSVVVAGNTHGVTAVDQDGQNITVIWDSLTITLTISDQRINVNANASGIVVSAIYNYDSTTYDGTLTLNNTDYNGDGTVTIWYYTVSSANGDDTYAITTILTNDNDYVIWDQIDIYNLGVSDYYQDINVAVTISCNALLEYDSHALGTGDTITFNGTSMTWNGTYFVSTVTESSTGYYAYTFATTGNEVTYGITLVDSWQWIWDCSNVTGWSWQLQQAGDTFTSDGTFMTYHFEPTLAADASRIYYNHANTNMTYVDYTIFYFYNRTGNLASGWSGAGFWEDPIPATSAFTVSLNLLSSNDTQWFMVEGTCNASVLMNRIWIAWQGAGPVLAECDLKFAVIALSARPYVAIVFDDVNVVISDAADQILYTGEGAGAISGTGTYDWGGETYDGTINTNWTSTQTTCGNYTFVVTTLGGDDTYGITTIGTNDDTTWIVWDKVNLTITANYEWSVVYYNVTLGATGVFCHLGWVWNGTETYNSTAVQYANQTTVGQYYYGNSSITSITDPDEGVITFNVVTPDYVVWDNATGTVLIAPGNEIGGNIPFTIFVYNLTWQYNDSYVDNGWDFMHIDNGTAVATVDSDGSGFLSPPIWMIVQPATDQAWNYSSNATATLADGRSFNFVWYSEDDIDVEEDFSITSPVYSESNEEWVLSAYANKNFNYIIWENDTQRSTGSKTEGSFRISYPKNATTGLWRWAINCTDGTNTLWINGSYTVGDTASTYSWIYLNLYGPDAIGVDPLLFKIYVNDTRIWSGNPQFYGLLSASYNITILNFLNETIVTGSYSVSERMIDVSLNVYTLFVYSQLDEEFIYFNLTSSGGATWTMYIPPRAYRDIAIYASTDYTYTFFVITGGEGGTYSGTVNIDYDYGIIISGVSIVDLFRGIEQINPTGSGRIDEIAAAVSYVLSGPLANIQFMIWLTIGAVILAIYIVPFIRADREQTSVVKKKKDDDDDKSSGTHKSRSEPVPRQLKAHSFKEGPLNPKYEGRDILNEMGDSIWKKLRGER